MSKENLKCKPLDGILNRELAIAQSKDLKEDWSPYLSELINHATHLLVRCEKSLHGVSGSPSALIFLYYHVIQLADAIQVLCSNSCFAAALPSLRSLWEGVISMEYMLQDRFEDRSTAWLACSHLDSKEYFELQDESTESGKKAAQFKKRDKFFSNADLGEKAPEILHKQINIYVEMLNKPKFATVLLRLSKGALRTKKWYALDKGPQSIRQMANELNRSVEYEFLYSYHSSVSHAKNASRVLGVDRGIVHFEPIRNSSQAIEVYTLTSSYLIMVAEMISGKLRPLENVKAQLKDIIIRHRKLEKPS